MISKDDGDLMNGFGGSWRGVGGWLLAGMLLSMSVLPQEPTADEIDQLAQRAMEAFQTPGIAIGVLKEGELVYAEGHGVREIGRPEPVDAETIFQIASLTKAFTAASLGILVDEGKLDWDDPVIDYLPEFRMYDTFVARWRDRSLHADAYVSFILGADGEVEAIRMKILSPDTDFSYDFDDLDLRWVGED